MWKRYDTSTTQLVSSTHLDGLQINVRHRCHDLTRVPVLCVHGATYSSRFFDVPHPGLNWLDALDETGFCTYTFDVRGYGLSRDPLRAVRKAPFARAAEAVEDIVDVARWILARHQGKLMLVGGSWGSITSALFSSTVGSDLVEKLVLYAPIFSGNPLAPDRALNVGAEQVAMPTRKVSETAIRLRWDNETPEGFELRDEAAFQALFQSSVADYGSSSETFEAPNGTLLDLAEAMGGSPLYDPEDIRCPTLLVRGELDPISTREDTLRLYARLGTTNRRYLEFGYGTHFVSAERKGPEVIKAIASFLEEPSR